MDLTPVRDKVLIKRDEVPTKTDTGLYLVPATRVKPLRGTVIKVGPGAINKSGERIPMTVQEGDTVIFAKYAGNEVEVEGTTYIIMKEEEIVAIESEL